MIRLFKILIACISAFFAVGASAFALGTTIDSIVPDNNVGVFEKSEDVVFTMNVSNAANEQALAVVRNINDAEAAQSVFSINSGVSKVLLNLGRFEPGWYRLVICSLSGSVEYNDFVSFVVTESYSSRKIYEAAPLALDSRVGEYNGNPVDFGDAYKLMGISQVRERAYYMDSYGGKTTLGTTTGAFSSNGINTLAVWSPVNDMNIWRSDLSNIYSWQEISANALNGRVNAWEIVNEPDIISGLPVDLYSAFLKTAALAVYDTDPALKKSFGAVCKTTSDDFARGMMQNGIMNYVDTYNIHTHQYGADSYSFRPLQSDLIKKGRLNSTLYGGGAPIWVSESGLRMNIGTGGVPSQNAMKTQAAYVITSFMEAIEQSGVDKYFCFLGTHYIEDGMEYGIFSENNMPYPAVSAISTLTYYLGKCDFLGMLRGTNGNTKGLVFDTGSGRAVVLYNSEARPGNAQIDTKCDATIVDLVGGTKTRVPNRMHDKINVHMYDTPIIVVLEDNNVQFDKKEFNHNTKKRELTDNDHLVIQPLWPADLQVSDGKYIVEPGETYNITLKVYNMSQSLLAGTLNIMGTDQIQVSETSKSYRIAKGGSTEIRLSVTVKDDAVPLSEGFLSVSGSKCTPCVGIFKISDTNIASVVGETTQISGFGTGWKRNDSATSRNYSTVDGKAKISATWDGSGPAWIYPKKSINIDASRYDGLYFTLDFDEMGNNTEGVISVNAYINGIISNAGKATVNEKTFYVPFESFEGLNTSDLTEIRIGFTEFGGRGTYTYNISDMGFYAATVSGTSYERPEIVINQLDNQNYLYYRKPSEIRADLSGEISDLKVYVNYGEYSNYTIEDSGVIIDTSDFEPGAVNIIVAGRDIFNCAVYDQINYYIAKKNELHPKGVCY